MLNFDQEGLLTVFDQRKSLQCNIGHFLMSWSINESPDQFVLLYDGSDRLMVTDKNRCEIKDGTMLRVVPSPRRTICDLLQQIRESQTETGKELYEQLATLCHQSSFAVEFCSQGGMQLLIENIGKPVQPSNDHKPNSMNPNDFHDRIVRLKRRRLVGCRVGNF